MKLDREALLALLPHRDPIFLLDGVLDYEPGAWLTAVKRIDPEDPILRGHFPGNPIYPGALIAEALAQAAVVLLRLDPANAERTYLIGGADGLRFRRPVRPGDVLTLEVRLTRRTASAAVARVRALVGTEWVARAELIAGSTRSEASS